MIPRHLRVDLPKLFAECDATTDYAEAVVKERNDERIRIILTPCKREAGKITPKDGHVGHAREDGHIAARNSRIKHLIKINREVMSYPNSSTEHAKAAKALQILTKYDIATNEQSCGALDIVESKERVFSTLVGPNYEPTLSSDGAANHLQHLGDPKIQGNSGNFHGRGNTKASSPRSCGTISHDEDRGYYQDTGNATSDDASSTESTSSLLCNSENEGSTFSDYDSDEVEKEVGYQ